VSGDSLPSEVQIYCSFPTCYSLPFRDNVLPLRQERFFRDGSPPPPLFFPYLLLEASFSHKPLFFYFNLRKQVDLALSLSFLLWRNQVFPKDRVLLTRYCSEAKEFSFSSFLPPVALNPYSLYERLPFVYFSIESDKGEDYRTLFTPSRAAVAGPLPRLVCQTHLWIRLLKEVPPPPITNVPLPFPRKRFIFMGFTFFRDRHVFFLP